MKKEELLNYNIMVGAELLANCYYDEVITEPKPIGEWVEYIYKAITKDFYHPDYIELGNNVARFFSKEVIIKKAIEYLNNNKELQKFIKK